MWDVCRLRKWAHPVPRVFSAYCSEEDTHVATFLHKDNFQHQDINANYPNKGQRRLQKKTGLSRKNSQLFTCFIIHPGEILLRKARSSNGFVFVFIHVIVSVFVAVFLCLLLYFYVYLYRYLYLCLLCLFVAVSIFACNYSCTIIHSSNPPLQGVLMIWMNADQFQIGFCI